MCWTDFSAHTVQVSFFVLDFSSVIRNVVAGYGHIPCLLVKSYKSGA